MGRNCCQVISKYGGGAEQILLEAETAASAEECVNAALYAVSDRRVSAVALNGADRTTLHALDPDLAEAARAIESRCTGYVSALTVCNGRLAAVQESFDGTRLHQQVVHAGRDGEVSIIDTAQPDAAGLRMLTGLDSWGDRLVLCMADPCAGAEIAVTDFNGVATVQLERGAHRFALNAAYTAVCPFEDRMLVGTAALNDDRLQVGNWGPELLLLKSDGWDLVMGQPRFSPNGLKQPLSNAIPGFGIPGNWAIKAITVMEDNSGRQAFAVMQRFKGAPVADRREVFPDFMDYSGEVRIFRSADLREWHPVEARLPDGAGAVTCAACVGSDLVLGHEAWGAGASPVTRVAVR